MNELNFSAMRPYAQQQSMSQPQLQQQQTQFQLQQQQQQPMSSMYAQMQQQQQQQQQISHQPHNMPTPSAAPWNLDSMPWNLASTTAAAQAGKVMHFSGNSNNAPPMNSTERRMLLHQKRKSNMVVSIPSKQFISEERMAAHFNGLHISNDYQQSTVNGNGSIIADDSLPGTSNSCYQVTSKELEEKLKNANRITVCEQMKKLQDEQKKASLLPETLMNRIVQPCTALVLWKPPPILELLHQQQTGQGTPPVTGKPENYIIGDIEYDDDDSVEDVDDSSLDNNNTCNLDFNNMKTDSMDEDL